VSRPRPIPNPTNNEDTAQLFIVYEIVHYT
jgi:hypothetical protein